MMTEYKPLSPEPWKPVQVIVATYPNGGGIEVDGEDGNRRLGNVGAVLSYLVGLKNKGFAVYSMHEGAKLVDATDGQLWTAHYWNGRVSKYVFAGQMTIYPIQADSFDLSLSWPFFEWLRGLGIQPGSFTGMSQKLWRLSLERKVSFFDEGQFGRLCLYGNRKEARRGVYLNMRYQDLSSAFPRAMSYNDFPCKIRESSRKSLFDVGYALATVRIPKGLDWGPLPCRLGKKAVVYGFGEQTDWWMHEDIRHVLAVGGSVAIHRNFRGFNLRPIFRGWFTEVVLPARNSLPTESAVLVKRLANRLWSSFAVGGSAKTVTWTEDSRRRVIDRTTELRGMRYETYIAAQVTALVRTQVFNGLLRMRDPVYVDTDGIICREFEDVGDGWRIKKKMRSVEIHSPHNYKWECYRSSSVGENCCPHYQLAVPTRSPKQAEAILKRVEVPVNPLMGITVLPTHPLEELRKKFKYEQPKTQGDEASWEWITKMDATSGWQTQLPIGNLQSS